MSLRAAPLHSWEQDPSVRVGLPFAFNHYLHMPDHLDSVTTDCMLCFLARRGALPHSSRSLYPPSPPMLGVVYVFLIPTCPRICVCFIYSMALVASCGVLRIVQSLCPPDGLAKMRFQVSSCHLQRGRLWATICRLSQRELVTSGTLRSKGKSLSQIYSVHDCTNSALSRSVVALAELDHLCSRCSRVCMSLDLCPQSSICLFVPSMSVVCTIV